MAARNSSSSFKLWYIYRYRIISGVSWRGNQAHHRNPPRFGGSLDQRLSFVGASSRAYTQSKENDQSAQVQPLPPLPAPAKFDFCNWAKWLLGSVLSLCLPFWRNKWDNLLRLEGTAEEIIKDVEVVAEVVDKVATTADAALMEVANQLPDNSKLKVAARALEHVSRAAAQDARLFENVIHKVGDVKQDLEELETIVEPIVEKIIRTGHSRH